MTLLSSTLAWSFAKRAINSSTFAKTALSGMPIGAAVLLMHTNQKRGLCCGHPKCLDGFRRYTLAKKPAAWSFR
eukprot:3129492-Pyramimonas_sp.AAC.1